MSLFQLVYYSEATRPFSEDDLWALLEQARRNNKARDITGCLLYGNGKFIQLLEGEENTVRALHGHIERDSRHKVLLDVSKEHCQERAFQGWTMGFRTLDDRGMPDGLKGLAESMHSASNTEASTGKKYLHQFAVHQGLLKPED